MCFFPILPTPVGAVKPLESRPFATYSILAINTGVWMLLNVFAAIPFFTGISPEIHDKILNALAFVPSEAAPWTYLTYAFTQVGILHLVLNLLFLWMFGSFLEEKIGGKLLLLFVVLGAVGGCTAHSLFIEVRNLTDLRDTPLIGASGVVMTILGAHLVLLPKLEFRFFYGIFGWFLRPYAYYSTVVMPSAFYIPVFIVVAEIVSLFSPKVTRVSHATHVGGLAVGMALGLVVRFMPQTKRKARMEQEKLRKTEQEKQSLLKENFLQALSEGKHDVAVSILRFAEKQGEPLSLSYEEKIRLCDLMTAAGEYFTPEKMYRGLLKGKLTDDQRLDVGLRLCGILLNFERDYEACKNLLRTLYRQYREHPRVGEIKRLVEQVKEVERNLFKRPR